MSGLAEQVALLTAAIPRAALAVTAISVDEWSPDARMPLVAMLRRVRCDWRLGDAAISIEVLGAWAIEPEELLSGQALDCRVRYPVLPLPDGTSLAALLTFSGNLRAWAENGAPVSAPIPAPLPDALVSFAEGYVRCVNALRAAPAPPFEQRFRVSRYEVSLSVPPVEWAMDATGGNPAIVTVTLDASRLVVVEPEFDEVFDALVRTAKPADLPLRNFYASARPRAAILRLSGSQLLLVLSGQRQGYPEVRILRATFDEELEILDAWRYQDDPATTLVRHRDAGQWFEQLISALETR